MPLGTENVGSMAVVILAQTLNPKKMKGTFVGIPASYGSGRTELKENGVRITDKGVEKLSKKYMKFVVV